MGLTRPGGRIILTPALSEAQGFIWFFRQGRAYLTSLKEKDILFVLKELDEKNQCKLHSNRKMEDLEQKMRVTEIASFDIAEHLRIFAVSPSNQKSNSHFIYIPFIFICTYIDRRNIRLISLHIWSFSYFSTTCFPSFFKKLNHQEKHNLQSVFLIFK